QVTETQNTSCVGYADETDILNRPVAEHFLDVTLARDREKQAARAPQYVIELEACLANRGVVDNWEEARRIGHQRVIEERFVDLEKVHQVNVTFQFGGLLIELPEDP